MEYITTDSNPDETVNPQMVNELVKAHIKRISDPHIKVSIACMASFTRLIAIFPEKIKQHLSQIFPQVRKISVVFYHSFLLVFLVFIISVDKRSLYYIIILFVFFFVINNNSGIC